MPKIQDILALFTQIAAIPRRSGQEAQISAWIQNWAAQRSLPTIVDSAGNLIVQVPAAPGCEQNPTFVLQAHLDMVCEKTPDSSHDFSRDPIRCLIEGEWMTADRTTLGADDGIGLALAMALVEDESAAHPPLELLFTVQEEVGIAGAARLEPGLLQGRLLINLDAEEEGVFIAGCAGGRATHLTLPLSFSDLPGSYLSQTLQVSGLQGGHSGVDIHKHRASANKLLARALYEALRAANIVLHSFSGGSAHNAISREARALFACPSHNQAALEKALQDLEKTIQKEFAATEKGIHFSLEDSQAGSMPAISATETSKVVDLLMALPHGVSSMAAEVPGFVETSNNLALIGLDESGLRITSSQRSTVMSRLAELTDRIEATGRLAGAQVTSSEGYPAWQPDLSSPLLERCRESYRKLFAKEPQVKMIHAGLECGIIGAKYAGMDMISLGVTTQNAHSPTERMFIPSVGKVYELLKEVVACTTRPTPQ